MGEQCKEVADLIREAGYTVAVTGAGVSTEAGIPDFRGQEGIYRKLGEERVTKLLNIKTFRRNPRQFYEFYRANFMFPKVQPSRSHLALAQLEKMGLLKGLVTQNIDGLHQRAGSKRVIPVHGRADRFYCTRIGCQASFSLDYVRKSKEVVPGCQRCGSILKPDVVLFGEPIQNHRQARDLILTASLLLVIGSSLSVYPLAGLVEEYAAAGGKLIIINQGRTPLDNVAAVKIVPDNLGATLTQINDLCKEKAVGKKTPGADHKGER